jgi:NADH:ubiquinone oxidoreductase subunit F (NADH-binding)/NADH:ubiquinone oxidoreductase subunit E
VPARDIAAVLSDFPRERRWLLSALHALQHREGHLSADALLAASAHLRVPASEVYGVATDYPEFRLQPHGRHHVRVCTGVTCALLGGSELLAAAERRCASTPRGPGEGVTVEAADCFFECSVAPLLEVDGRYRGRVTGDDIDRLDRWFLESPERHHSTFAVADAGRTPSPAIVGAVGTASAAATLDELVASARARQAGRPAIRLLVQVGSCGRAVGGDDVLAALVEARHRRALRPDLEVAIVEGACNGMCYAAPLVVVEHTGHPHVVIERLAPERASALLDVIVDEKTSGKTSFESSGFTGVVLGDTPWRGLAPAAAHPFWRGQERVLLRRVGVIDPASLDDALLHGAYRALARALDASPESVIDEVKRAGLQGRGGAFFPAAVKWEGCRKSPGEPKYLVMNGEEGEPGIFKDRHLMEADPHQILEGVLIAAYAAGATRAILYVHGEANLSAERLAHAVSDAERAGIVGERMLGRPVACHVELRRGAGGFVLGEETALLESIEGRRAQPRTRPPFPVESGLWGRPTVINNVETLAAVPSILELGADRFAGLGTPKAPGTKVFGLSGPIHRPGVVETRNGVTLRQLLLEIGGGLVGDLAVKGALVGGPSGSVIPAALFDVPMEPRERVSPGTGGIVAVPATASIVDVVRTLLGFNARESCGKCTPCREGAPRLHAMIDELRAATDPSALLGTLRDLADTMQLASLCGLGQAAPLALMRALADFPEEFGLRKA